MCGRYALIYDDAFHVRFHVAPPRLDVTWSYNVAPGRDVPVVAHAAEGRQLALVRWGLRPAWLTGPGSTRGIINVRAETLTAKPTFRAALRHGRVLVPATGFYEWAKDARGAKQPYFFRGAEAYLAFAGLRDGDGVAILTTAANATVARVHGRMPAILDPTEEARWIDPALGEDEAAALLTPAPDSLLTATVVSRAVNNARIDGPELLTPYDASDAAA